MYNSKVIRAISGVTCVMLFAKILAMLRSILQARTLGAGQDMDAFTLASNYSVSLFTTICYAMCIAAIPLLSQALMKDRQTCFHTANKLIGSTFLLSLLLLGALFFLGSSGLVESYLGFAGDVSLFRFCFLVLLPTLPVITLTYLLLALFQSMEHYALQGSLSLLYNLVLCLLLVLLRDRLTVPMFAVLTSVCWLLQLCMTLPYFRREGFRLRPRLSFGKPYRSFLRVSIMTMYNSSLFLLCYLLNTHFSAASAAGTVSSFSYAQRLYEPLSTALLYSLSIVLFPTFSQKYTTMEPQEYRNYVVQIIKNALLFILPLSMLLAAFGSPIICILFQGGDFTWQDGLLCGSIFSKYALGMAGFFLLDLLNKAYYAMGKTLFPILATSAALAVCLGSNALFSHFFPNEPHLLALGTSVSFLFAGFFAYLIFARNESVPIPKKPLLWSIFLSVLAGLAGRALYLHFFADSHSKLFLLVGCGAIGLVLLAAYLVLMGPMAPTREILQKMRRRKPS